MARLAPGPAEVVDYVPVGRLALDGTALVDPDGNVLRARKRLMNHGHIAITLVADGGAEVVGPPRVRATGLAGEGNLETALAAAIEKAVRGMGRRARTDAGAIEAVVRRAVNKVTRPSGKRPLVSVDVIAAPADGRGAAPVRLAAGHD